MNIIVGVLGIVLILTVLWDTFETIVLPRIVTRQLRLTRIYYYWSWTVLFSLFKRMKPGNRRESMLSIYGPLSLLMLISFWAVVMVFGFACLHWALGSQVIGVDAHPNFGTDLYLSGTTFFTLGFGDITPSSGVARIISVTEAGLGFGLLAIIISYLPVLYQSFSRREVSILLLDARAGSPPTAEVLLQRHLEANSMDALCSLLESFEKWSAELLESYISYPILAFYRSQHGQQSWLAALTCILDTCALIEVGFEGTPEWEERIVWQSKLTFAMARHVIVDLALIVNAPPQDPEEPRLTKPQWEHLRRRLSFEKVVPNGGDECWNQLLSLRRQYEPFLQGLANDLIVTIPGWLPEINSLDNWQTSAWDSVTHFTEIK